MLMIILQSSSPSPSAQTVSDSDNLCDICWSAVQCTERAKVVFLYYVDTQDSVKYVLTDVWCLTTKDVR